MEFFVRTDYLGSAKDDFCASAISSRRLRTYVVNNSSFAGVHLPSYYVTGGEILNALKAKKGPSSTCAPAGIFFGVVASARLTGLNELGTYVVGNTISRDWKRGREGSFVLRSIAVVVGLKSI